MPYRLIRTRARTGLMSLVTLLVAVMMSWTTPAAAQQPQGQRPPRNPRSVRNVLGGVEMTAADSAVKAIVDRLDFDSYKEILLGLTQFGDREQGTERNARAIDWIEEQLQSWGYETGRIHYDYTSRRDSVTSPREEVYATLIGSTIPSEMYIIGGHMDGRGGGEAANDDGSGTALVMEIARALAADDIETARSVRFALWNNEETGLQGSRAYVEQRAPPQASWVPALLHTRRPSSP